MRAEIHITGGINGSYEIRRKLSGYESEGKLRFGGIVLRYKSVKAATDDMRECWRKMKVNDMDRYGSVYRSAGGYPLVIKYDASEAVLHKCDNF